MNDHFVIAGAQRCGTTFLYRYLAAHPEIEMAAPERPEPKFFLRRDLGVDAAEQYRAEYFGRKPGAHRFGEKSTSYLEFEEVAILLERHLPGVQVVVVVRDPVERAISHVRFSQDSGLETRTLHEALCPGGPAAPRWVQGTTSVDPFAYLSRGFYADHLDRYLRHIDESRVHVLVFEEMIGSNEPLAELLQFLRVDPDRAAAIDGPVNASAGTDVSELECRSALAEVYREPNRRLEELLGRSLDLWA